MKSSCDIKKCEVCGKDFIAKRKYYKTCSKECKNKLIGISDYKTKHREVTKICPTCKLEFKITYKYRNKKVYCSKKCRNKLKIFLCEICGKEITAYNPTKFCSMKCRKEHNRRVRIIIIEKRNKNKCLTCGKPCIEKYCGTKCFSKSIMKPLPCKICGKLASNRISHSFCSENCRQLAIKNKSKKASEMMKANNPAKTPESRRKNSIAQKKRIANMTPEEKTKFLKNWMDAPRYKQNWITKPEQMIIDFNINGLKYTGDGTKWVTFPNGKHKNPDFIKGLHVVEVGDFHYWHTEEERINVINNYNLIGYKCLYLTTDEVYNNKDIKNQIEGFLQS
jgi:hypothetical protein